jgi:hypothetical protein
MMRVHLLLYPAELFLERATFQTNFVQKQLSQTLKIRVFWILVAKNRLIFANVSENSDAFRSMVKHSN